MRILLLGKNGQVGWELQRALSPLGEVIACSHAEADLEAPDQLRKLVRNILPAVVVNAAAYTAVDKAESDTKRAMCVNGEAVGVLAEETRRLGGWLVHYSTDYVFDGNKNGYYTETDMVAPQSVYGNSKLAGENAIQQSGCRHLIMRTSWVFAMRGGNFAKTMLRLAKDRDELKVVNDQIGVPTNADLIADVTALALNRIFNDPGFAERTKGIYHLAPAGETSWHGYAKFLIGEARRLGVSLRTIPERVLPIGTSDYPTLARRPANSRLATTKLRETFGLKLAPWELAVTRWLTQMHDMGVT